MLCALQESRLQKSYWIPILLNHLAVVFYNGISYVRFDGNSASLGEGLQKVLCFSHSTYKFFFT